MTKFMMTPAGGAGLCALLCLVLLSCGVCFAQDSGQIEQELRQREKNAAARRKNVETLAREEKKLGKRLGGLKNEVDKLAAQAAAQEDKVKAAKREERRLAGEYAALEKQKGGAAEKLSALLRAMWPVHLQNLENRTAGLASWEDADRRLTWLTRLYASVGDAYRNYRNKTDKLAAALERREAAGARLQQEYKKAAAAKNALLSKQLSYKKELRKVRKKRLSEEEQLKEIIDVIGKLNYRLKSMGEGDIARFKGTLPRPAAGKVVAGFAPRAKPPRRGLGLAVAKGALVRAVHAGKVAHADTLRGMGKVVIVMHGGDFYSVYAYLSDVNAAVGDDVARGQRLGTAGYYPKANGPGLYFELRFRKKAINPENWLAAPS